MPGPLSQKISSLYFKALETVGRAARLSQRGAVWGIKFSRPAAQMAGEGPFADTRLPTSSNRLERGTRVAGGDLYRTAGPSLLRAVGGGQRASSAADLPSSPAPLVVAGGVRPARGVCRAGERSVPLQGAVIGCNKSKYVPLQKAAISKLGRISPAKFSHL
jgi:hypothetical protein